jgi:ABC-2 type transport system ATP-binding protein
LFLDEPTTGFDPRSRIAVWEAVTGLVDEGVTVLLTTQYLEEADRLANRIAVIDHGRVVAQGTAAELKAGAAVDTLDEVFLAVTA